jgi:hypothetical protein
VRAVCLNWARTDRCGGRFERTFPTAIRNIGGNDIRAQAEFIAGLFQVAA